MLGETFVEELRLAHTIELGTDSPVNLSRPGTQTNRRPTTSDIGDNAVGSSKHGDRSSKKGLDLDPRTMGIATTDCLAGVSADVSGAITTFLGSVKGARSGSSTCYEARGTSRYAIHVRQIVVAFRIQHRLFCAGNVNLHT